MKTTQTRMLTLSCALLLLAGPLTSAQGAEVNGEARAEASGASTIQVPSRRADTQASASSEQEANTDTNAAAGDGLRLGNNVRNRTESSARGFGRHANEQVRSAFDHDIGGSAAGDLHSDIGGTLNGGGFGSDVGGAVRNNVGGSLGVGGL